jgi:hypothetical protein
VAVLLIASLGLFWWLRRKKVRLSMTTVCPRTALADSGRDAILHGSRSSLRVLEKPKRQASTFPSLARLHLALLVRSSHLPADPVLPKDHIRPPLNYPLHLLPLVMRPIAGSSLLCPPMWK